MLTHIHPSRLWFTCETMPIFNDTAYPGPESRAGHGPPGAQSPFARNRCYLLRCGVLHHIREHYPSFIAHTGSCTRPKPSRRLRLSLIRRVFAGCRQSLLGVGPSRHYLCNPCMGAWTPTPQCPPGALARFFPRRQRPYPRRHKFGTPKLPLQCNFNRELILGAAVIPLCSGSHAR